MRLSTTLSSSCAKLCASLLFSSAVLTGCSSSLTSMPVSEKAIAVSGNWQISSTSAAAAALPTISGTLSGSSTALSGIFHANGASTCADPKAAFTVGGAADADGKLTLTGPIGGGTLTVTGTLAADGKSVSGAQYKVSGGACAFPSAAQATMQSYAPVTGTYAGRFYDADSATTPVLSMTATLTQSPNATTNGDFTLTGQATLPNNPCFSSPTQVSSAQVTGGSFTMTDADTVLGNTVIASGTFSPDGKTLTITHWQSAGTCGADAGTGTLVQQ